MILEVITGTKEELESALLCPAIDPDDFDTITAHMEFLNNVLEEKNAEKAEVVSLRSITPLEDQSDNFSLIGDILRSMLFFTSLHEYPKTIRIVCDNEETAKLYKVIYNFWFAEEKSDRLDDDSWD